MQQLAPVSMQIGLLLEKRSKHIVELFDDCQACRKNNLPLFVSNVVNGGLALVNGGLALVNDGR
jgi:hypothetical protein